MVCPRQAIHRQLARVPSPSLAEAVPQCALQRLIPAGLKAVKNDWIPGDPFGVPRASKKGYLYAKVRPLRLARKSVVTEFLIKPQVAK